RSNAAMTTTFVPVRPRMTRPCPGQARISYPALLIMSTVHWSYSTNHCDLTSGSGSSDHESQPDGGPWSPQVSAMRSSFSTYFTSSKVLIVNFVPSWAWRTPSSGSGSESVNLG